MVLNVKNPYSTSDRARPLTYSPSDVKFIVGIVPILNFELIEIVPLQRKNTIHTGTRGEFTRGKRRHSMHEIRVHASMLDMSVRGIMRTLESLDNPVPVMIVPYKTNLVLHVMPMAMVEIVDGRRYGRTPEDLVYLFTGNLLI